MGAEDANRGTYYIAISWVLTTIALTVVTARLYSRTILTRSVGSDDFAIIVAAGLTIAGEVNNTISYSYGFGRHEKYLSPIDIAQITKWEYIDWIIVFLSYFFIRTSVMLFVLRLLPPQKRWQPIVIYIAFFLNFAITIIGTVTFGIECVPFRAIYEHVPGAKCLSKNVNTASQYVNGILACVIDITTALIPEFLIWRVRLNPRKKLFLYPVFGLGLLTAGLSIGRVAATNDGIWTIDSTWRVLPPDTFSMFEEKLGIIFASCPALRQFFAYRRRMGTFRPAPGRQPPNADFIKFRRRVNLRDILWYRKAVPINGRVVEARRIFQATDVDLHNVNTEHAPEPAPAEKSHLDLVESAAQRKARWLSLPFRKLRPQKSSSSTLRQGLTMHP